MVLSLADSILMITVYLFSTSLSALTLPFQQQDNFASCSRFSELIKGWAKHAVEGITSTVMSSLNFSDLQRLGF
jgi:hypothetical protein